MVVAVAVVVEPRAVGSSASAKGRLKAWVKAAIEGEGTLRAPDVATLAVDELSQDREFLADFGTEMLRTAVYELVLDVIAEGRGSAHEISALQVPQSQISPTHSTDGRVNANRRLAMLTRRFNSWWEHVGDRHVALLEMTVADLQIAEDERRTRGTHEIRMADFLASLRKRLTGDQKVGERFVDLEQIELVRSATIDRKG